jgi:hypothetical protein
MTHEHRSHDDGATPAAAKWVFIGFLLVAGYFLVMEHRAHLSAWLSAYGIWLLLLACPLMHLFMHHGHGHSGHQSNEVSNDSTRSKQ